MLVGNGVERPERYPRVHELDHDIPYNQPTKEKINKGGQSLATVFDFFSLLNDGFGQRKCLCSTSVLFGEWILLGVAQYTV